MPSLPNNIGNIISKSLKNHCLRLGRYLSWSSAVMNLHLIPKIYVKTRNKTKKQT